MCFKIRDLRMSSLSKLILCISKARILRKKIIEKSYASRLEGELTPAVVFVERVRIGKSEHRGRTRRGERMTSAFLNKFLFIFFLILLRIAEIWQQSLKFIIIHEILRNSFFYSLSQF